MPQKQGSDKNLTPNMSGMARAALSSWLSRLPADIGFVSGNSRAATDWAEEIKGMVNSRPEAKKIILVMDTIRTSEHRYIKGFHLRRQEES